MSFPSPFSVYPSPASHFLSYQQLNKPVENLTPPNDQGNLYTVSQKEPTHEEDVISLTLHNRKLKVYADKIMLTAMLTGDKGLLEIAQKTQKMYEAVNKMLGIDPKKEETEEKKEETEFYI